MSAVYVEGLCVFWDHIGVTVTEAVFLYLLARLPKLPSRCCSNWPGNLAVWATVKKKDSFSVTVTESTLLVYVADLLIFVTYCFQTSPLFGKAKMPQT